MVRAYDGDYGDDEPLDDQTPSAEGVSVLPSLFVCTCPEPFGEDDLMCAACESIELACRSERDSAELGNPTDEEWATFAARQG